MRSRLGGIAVALALVLAGCGSDRGTQDASTRHDDRHPVELDLVSARDTLPPAPVAPGALTVLLTHPGGGHDAGLDAAAGALAQRPDIGLVLAAAGADTTMSGFTVEVTGLSSVDAVAAALDDPERSIDLVLVGVTATQGIGEIRSEADVAVQRGVPALIVAAERTDVVDHAAATMQLLEVLDLELDALLQEPVAVHRLTVPSCSHGMLRGRLSTSPGAADRSVRADCTSTVRAPSSEADAFAHGWVTLTRLDERVPRHPNN